ncbi:hypothetical protein A1O3_04541 [Capronia epimyces CBS 606.96]|uniref:RanBP2-type domain-containing protein n=1 Tax=Capronia epimyces CBS 606.96 TaxID=1182542 RepID=W9YE83_9EURO|nr:uncharacterized protein A1O3_04541 [Capronia epimyces CBS 606.96]EXJ87581.1 hypothetical protein A1O3_04541 [Capronia epimyces CBS 606.96]
MPEKRQKVGPANGWVCCQCQTVNLDAIHTHCPSCHRRRCINCRKVHIKQRSPSRKEDRRPPR